MYDPKTGEVVCDWCGDPIGNINGDYNYFALIRTKYCSKCGTFARKESVRSAVKAYRRRQKKIKKLTNEKIELITRENELLRQKIRKMSEDNEIEEP